MRKKAKSLAFKYLVGLWFAVLFGIGGAMYYCEKPLRDKCHDEFGGGYGVLAYNDMQIICSNGERKRGVLR